MIMDFITQRKRLVAIVAFVIMAVVTNLISIFALNISIVPVCCLIIIEAALAGCMHRAQIWVHGLFLLGQIIAGILTENIVLMVLCVIMYIIALVTLEFSFEIGEI